MALRFFRQRQKLVLIVMVLLMFAFLLSSVIPSFFRRKPGQYVVGRVGEEEITAGMARGATGTLSLLGNDPIALGSFRFPRPGEVAFTRFFAVNGTEDAKKLALENGYGDARALAWTLLVLEARQMGIRVTGRDVEALLRASGLHGKRLDEEIANLSLKGYTRRNVDAAVAEYLMVMDAFAAATPAAPPTLSALPQMPPSLPEMRHATELLNERVQLAIATFSAKDFLEGVAEPTQDQIAEQFAKNKHLLPRDPTNKTKFGFGYRQHDQARIAWLFVDYKPLLEAVEPSEEQMSQHWLEYKGQITKKVRELPAGAPGSQPASGPAPEPVERNVVIEDYAEALPIIRQRLRPAVTAAKASRLLWRAQQLIAAKAGAEDAYAEAVEALIGPADELLKIEVPPLPALDATLKDVIERVAEVSGVKIVYPLGTHGTLTLDAKLKIKLPPSAKKPLGRILEDIRKQVQAPEIKWVVCEDVPGAIFPVEPVNLAPVTTGRTELLGRNELRSHELLGRAWTDPTAGQPLLEVLATAKAFQGPKAGHVPLIEPGKDFRQAMFVGGRRRGRLLWRLLEARPESDPETCTEKIARQVAEDLKTAAAFDKAAAAADALLAKLAGGELAKLAKDAKAKYRKTELMARKRISPWVWDDFRLIRAMGEMRFLAAQAVDDLAARDRLQRLRAGVYQAVDRFGRVMQFNPEANFFAPSEFVEYGADLEAAGADVLAANEKLIEEAFKLAPRDRNKPVTDAPAAVVALPRLRKVLLVQRIGYDIPAEAEFEGRLTNELRQLLKAPQRQRAMGEWFRLENVIKRTGYQRADTPAPATPAATSRPAE